MNNNTKFEDCKKKGKIKRFSRGKALSSKELNLALSDYNTAEGSFKEKIISGLPFKLTIQCFTQQELCFTVTICVKGAISV